MSVRTTDQTHLNIGSHASSSSVVCIPAEGTGMPSGNTQSALEKAHNNMVIKADINKEGWETSEFPILCETCLGPNPFVRMEKEPFGLECKICTRPFTLFRWKPGGDARYKATVVCQTCSRLKNCCQTCLFDLEYGLPVQVRDKYLAEQDKIDMPDSVVNREYYIQQQQAKIESGELPYGKEKNAMLMKIARKNPYYKRNEAKICSFFVKGTCNRGDECPYRHEMPETGELANQKIRDRFHGVNDPVANKIFRQAKEMYTLKPPDDKSITTLYVGGVDPSITEQDLRGVFYVHGELKAVKPIPKQSCAFINYKTREGAEAAADKLYRNLKIKGHTLRIQWAQKTSANAGPGREELAEKKRREAAENNKDPLQQPGAPMTYNSMNPSFLNNAPLESKSNQALTREEQDAKGWKGERGAYVPGKSGKKKGTMNKGGNNLPGEMNKGKNNVVSEGGGKGGGGNKTSSASIPPPAQEQQQPQPQPQHSGPPSGSFDFLQESLVQQPGGYESQKWQQEGDDGDGFLQTQLTGKGKGKGKGGKKGGFKK
ncbi:unnamed protein product [Amoebophrya sp. A120]|nr:unnamed protein product [Amoebophrya sp. A120]|eukprot:GSA120T00007236001.1